MSSIIRKLFNLDFYTWRNNGKIKPENHFPSIDLTPIRDAKVEIVYDESYVPSSGPKKAKLVSKPISLFSNLNLHNEKFNPKTCKELIDFIPPPEPVEPPPTSSTTTTTTNKTAPAQGKIKLSLSKPETKDPTKKITLTGLTGGLKMSDGKEAGAAQTTDNKPILQKQTSSITVPKLSLSRTNSGSSTDNKTSPAPAAPPAPSAAPAPPPPPPPPPPQQGSKPLAMPTAPKVLGAPIAKVTPPGSGGGALSKPTLNIGLNASKPEGTPVTKPAFGGIQKPNIGGSSLPDPIQAKSLAPNKPSLPDPIQAKSIPATSNQPIAPPPNEVNPTPTTTTTTTAGPPKSNAWGNKDGSNTWNKTGTWGQNTPTTAAAPAAPTGAPSWGTSHKGSGWNAKNNTGTSSSGNAWGTGLKGWKR